MKGIGIGATEKSPKMQKSKYLSINAIIQTVPQLKSS